MGKSAVTKKPSVSPVMKKPSGSDLMKKVSSPSLGDSISEDGTQKPGRLERKRVLSETRSEATDLSTSEEAKLYAPDCFLYLWDTLTSDQKEYLRKASKVLKALN